MKNYRIGILGVGGVGGYLGAKLAFPQLKGVEIIFIARNETKAVLKKNGLKLITDSGEENAHASLVSDDPAEIGRLDLLICTVKGYDLEASLAHYRPCVDQDSVVLPLLNGIGIAEKVKKILPGPKVWEACIYIVARQVDRGVIRQSGTMDQVFFGSPDAGDEALAKLLGLFEFSGINAQIARDMDTELWKKFFFISVVGTFTSYYNAGVGLAQHDSERAGEVREMLAELEKIALKKGIKLPVGISTNTYDRIMSLDPGATSSIYADFQKKGPTEVEELTGDVVRLGKQYGIPTPLYDKMYQRLTP